MEGVSKETKRDAVCAEVVKLLSEERQKKGLSMNALAGKAGLSQSLISTLESNPWNPTLDTLLRIADVLEVELGEILIQASKAVNARAPKR